MTFKIRLFFIEDRIYFLVFFKINIVLIIKIKFKKILLMVKYITFKLILIILPNYILFIKSTYGKELALFAFNGCYGHDILMRQIGDEFDNFNLNQQLKNKYVNKSNLIGNEIWTVNWIQIFMYNFGFGQIKRPKHWRSIVVDHSNEQGKLKKN